MNPHPTSDEANADGRNDPLDEVLGLTLQIRDTFNAGFSQLRELSQKLKLIHREQKSSTREFSTLRSTLRSLQGLKL